MRLITRYPQGIPRQLDFVRQMMESPLDDNIKLMYSDWLEENNGEKLSGPDAPVNWVNTNYWAEWAEYIRGRIVSKEFMVMFEDERSKLFQLRHKLYDEWTIIQRSEGFSTQYVTGTDTSGVLTRLTIHSGSISDTMLNDIVKLSQQHPIVSYEMPGIIRTNSYATRYGVDVGDGVFFRINPHSFPDAYWEFSVTNMHGGGGQLGISRGVGADAIKQWYTGKALGRHEVAFIHKMFFTFINSVNGVGYVKEGYKDSRSLPVPGGRLESTHGEYVQRSIYTGDMDTDNIADGDW